MADNVKITGVDEIIERFEEIADANAFKKAMGKACAEVVTSAVQNYAPKGDGALRRSIAYEVQADGGEIVGVVYTPLEYAPYVEFGTGLFAENGDGRKDVPWVYCDDKGEFHSTRGQHPHPFLRPALNDNREQIKRILKGGLKVD